MQRYNPKDIEPRWQKIWDETGVYTANLTSDKPKYIAMSMFNYPSGNLHIGHAMNYTISDVKARFKRQQGYESYHPVGWDSFGLPAENRAIKQGISPQESMAQLIPEYHTHYKAMGWSNDWEKEIATHLPGYYKWTQWIFTQMYKHGLAYQDARMQWWCEKDNTVLANEQVIDGKCWRHDGPDDPLVEKKEIKQWFFKITDYADELLEATESLDWTESVKLAQKNWIGKSKGAEINFQLDSGITDVVIVHGKGNVSTDGWYPWLQEQLTASGLHVHVPAFPSEQNSKLTDWKTVLAGLDVPLESTVFIGHSRGAMALLRWAQALPNDKKVKRMVLVAPNFDHQPERTDTDEFYAVPLDFNDLLATCSDFAIVHSEDDEFAPIAAGEYIAEKLQATFHRYQNAGHFGSENLEAPEILQSVLPSIRVFTTRADTIFGATFLVVAPEHELLENANLSEEVKRYIDESVRKTELERMEGRGGKTGVFSGMYAINPATNEKVPVWVADYVLAGYGTGAIMAVPAHDERDYEFAVKYELPITDVVEAPTFDDENPPREGKKNTTREVVICVIKNKDGKYLTLKWNKLDWQNFVMGGVENGEDIVEAAKREIAEETGYTDLKFTGRMPFALNSVFYAAHKDVNRDIRVDILSFELMSETQQALSRDEIEDFEPVWIEQSELSTLHPVGGLDYIVRWVNEGDYIYAGEGRVCKSEQYSGLQSASAREKIVTDLAAKGMATEKINYKMRDWSVSRQRYWGAPIPIVHCEKCGPVLIPESKLPVVLPELTDFKPAGDGRSALARAKDWLEVDCPDCGGKAERETDTLDTYICSSWYMYRYFDPHNQAQIFDPEVAQKWEPIDFYNGADHATAHLLYARFVTRFFTKIGLLKDPEPFKQFVFNGKVTAQDGTMFSKSKGNGVDPLEIIAQGYGADALRTYLMFAAPLDVWARWDPQGVPGTYRFLNRLWTITQEYHETETLEISEQNQKAIRKSVHEMIQKTTIDLEENRYNTAISAVMKCVNDLYKLKVKEFGKSDVWQGALEACVACIAPFAPHMTDELWQQLGHSNSVHKDSWPTFEEKYLVSETMTIVVQVNGKVRANLQMPKDASEDEIVATAKADSTIKAHLNGEPKRVIYISNKLLNFVI